MPRLKFVATAIKRASKGTQGYESKTPTTQAIYLDSNAVEIGPEGAGTYFYDKVSKDWYTSAKTYSATITALDSASGSNVGYAVDLT